MKRKSVIVLAMSLLAACGGASVSDTRGPDPTISTHVEKPVSASPDRRGLTRPDVAIVDNQAEGRFHDRVRTAIADLKAISFWDELTDELFVVEISARPGRAFVPEDAHLADAYRTLDIRDASGGVLCDITFYPTAMNDDLARWRDYHGRGLMADPPPTPRQLWASILAHELSHCFKKNNDEDSAAKWEARALRALRDAGLR